MNDEFPELAERKDESGSERYIRVLNNLNMMLPVGDDPLGYYRSLVEREKAWDKTWAERYGAREVESDASERPGRWYSILK